MSNKSPFSVMGEECPYEIVLDIVGLGKVTLMTMYRTLDSGKDDVKATFYANNNKIKSVLVLKHGLMVNSKNSRKIFYPELDCTYMNSIEFRFLI